MVNDIKIIPESSNVFRVINGKIEIEIYCADGSIQVTDKTGGEIEYPMKMMGGIGCKDRVKFKGVKE